MYDETLEHHGVKGQKWGVRRKGKNTVSKGGSKKAEGRLAKAKKAYNLNKASKNREKNFINDYKKRGSMSTKDLKKQVERLRLETEYKNLTNQMVNANAKQRKQRIDALKTAIDLGTKGYEAYKKSKK